MSWILSTNTHSKVHNIILWIQIFEVFHHLQSIFVMCLIDPSLTIMFPVRKWRSNSNQPISGCATSTLKLRPRSGIVRYRNRRVCPFSITQALPHKHAIGSVRLTKYIGFCFPFMTCDLSPNDQNGKHHNLDSVTLHYSQARHTWNCLPVMPL